MKKDARTIVLTGATGFLGSHLMAALAENGYEVIVLGRSQKNESLTNRINKLSDWFGIEPDTDIECIEADLLKVKMGIPDESYSKLCSSADSIIHCASDTSFAESKREKVISANVDSLKGILEFARDSHVKIFHYISTVYVAGKEETYCKETLPEAKTFTNVYEESKAAAEKIIAGFCSDNSIPLSIIRPSIVYGDSRTGRSLKFNALYFPVRSALTIRDIYLKDLKNGAKKSEKLGIHIDGDGYLFLPLRIYLPEPGNINLIPVEYFVKACMQIIENCSKGGIFQLSNNSPVTLDLISKYFERMMRVRGIEVIYGSQKPEIFRNPAEELFAKYIEPYRPYLSDTKVFERKNTDEITGNLHPPEFTYQIFEKCMSYAIETSWGEKIFSS